MDKKAMENIIYIYSRREALADGNQVEVSATAKEAGLKFPVFLTRAVYDQYVTVPEGLSDQDEAGRLWDIVWMLRHGIKTAPADMVRLPFELYVKNSEQNAPQLVTLIAECGPIDFDDPRPAITIMLPDEN